MSDIETTTEVSSTPQNPVGNMPTPESKIIEWVNKVEVELENVKKTYYETLVNKIDGVETSLNNKIDGVEKNLEVNISVLSGKIAGI
ncbi:MAG: hypothetical protein LBF40_05140 [Deltaproteobacteria bacterium]|nr:hypothetical protein [Deltaproteobacteria bacterium]